MKNLGLRSFYLSALSSSKDSFYLIEKFPDGTWDDPIPLITKTDEKRFSMIYSFLIEKAREVKNGGTSNEKHFKITIQPLKDPIIFVSFIGEHLTLCEPPSGSISELNRIFKKNSF